MPKIMRSPGWAKHPPPPRCHSSSDSQLSTPRTLNSRSHPPSPESRMKNSSAQALFASVCAALLTSLPLTSVATINSWIGGSGEWNTAANWSRGSAPRRQITSRFTDWLTAISVGPESPLPPVPPGQTHQNLTVELVARRRVVPRSAAQRTVGRAGYAGPPLPTHPIGTKT